MLPRGSVEDAVYTEVGRALSKWEGLEFTLSETYEVLLRAQTDGAAYGYGLLTAFTGRHALLESAGPKFNYGVGAYAYAAEQVASYGKHFHDLTFELAPYRKKIRDRW